MKPKIVYSAFWYLVSLLIAGLTSCSYAQELKHTNDTLSIQQVLKTKEYQLLFEDGFNNSGKPDAKDWLYRNNAKMGGISWPGNLVQKVSTDPSGNHALHIEFTYESSLPDGQQYRGGGVASTHNFGYGYYEIKTKLYGGSAELAGLHSSFWSMGLTGTNEAEGKGVRDSLVYLDLIPQENRVLEIDGFEQNSNKNELGLNYHIYTPTHQNQEPKPSHINKDLSKWIVMAYEWLPDRINYYSDGKHIATQKLEGIWKLYAPQNLWLTALPVNLTGWGGLLKPGKDASMQVDYFRFYGKDLPGVNRIGNAGFEYGKTDNTYPIAWITSRTQNNNKEVGKVVTDSLVAQTGKRFLLHQSKQAYQAITKQIIEYIPNGTYKFTGWVKSSGGQKKAEIVIKTGAKQQAMPISTSKQWTKITLKNIKVTDHKAVIEICSNAAADQWLMVDNLEFYQ